MYCRKSLVMFELGTFMIVLVFFEGGGVHGALDDGREVTVSYE